MANKYQLDWHTGNLDPRFTEVMNLVDEVEASIPTVQDKIRMYQDFRDTMDNRRKALEPKRQWWKIW